MVASVLQEKESNSTAAGAAIGVTFASNNVAGSAIHAIVTWGTPNADLTSVTDSRNTYSAVLNKITDTANNQSMAQCIAFNIGAGANTVTANFTNTPTFIGIWAREIGSVNIFPNPTDGTSSNYQVTTGTGVDAVTSLSTTNVVQPVLMSALSLDGAIPTAPTAGTGFTSNTSGWTFGAIVAARSEHQRFTNTTAKAATYTAASTSSTFLTMMAMFDEIGAGIVVSTGAYRQESTSDRYQLEDGTGVYLIEPWGIVATQNLPPWYYGDLSGIQSPGRLFKDKLSG